MSEHPIAFDPATTTQALTQLKSNLGGGNWYAVPAIPRQEHFIAWYNRHWKAAEDLSDLQLRVAASHEPLNAFFQENGYPPKFRPFADESLGVAAILKMVKRWLTKGQVTIMPDGQEPLARKYRAFEMPKQGVEIFDLPEPYGPLVKILADDGSAAWLMTPSVIPQHGMDLLDTASWAMSQRQPANTAWISSVVVPMVDVEVDVPLDWMLGAACCGYKVTQAFQKIIVKLNEEGFEAGAGTGIVASRSFAQPAPLVFNRPFGLWFTQAESELPITLLYCTPNQWQMI